jgi:hypothetical protein
MSTHDKAKLIAEYEKLRERLFELEALATAIDHRLVELEGMLPQDYTHRDDLPKSGRPKRS